MPGGSHHISVSSSCTLRSRLETAGIEACYGGFWNEKGQSLNYHGGAPQLHTLARVRPAGCTPRDKASSRSVRGWSVDPECYGKLPLEQAQALHLHYPDYPDYHLLTRHSRPSQFQSSTSE